MSDSNKSFRRYMHKESTDEFNSGNGEFFPLTFFTIIFHIVCNSIFVHTDDAVITDSDSMCVLTKIVNNRLGTIEGFLAVRDPDSPFKNTLHNALDNGNVHLWVNLLFLRIYAFPNQ